eukprot:CAMPEP_0203844844 /NCGR_PEP_ID=MMETSP0359-20131031/3456_1 /ASSEMBLY_ACC=CAM_ASM_000338 /TAXON_ID=268821 /ORGANISM="Scrippsiella Hangoei, Strain SHTV-5" /LENGTH=347 /DNA_ID=CAMNT_0050759879 /DNA_START=50 /DNA_END=1093 /DNA_ORIENTATION=-
MAATRPRWGVMGLGKISNDFSCSIIANGSPIAAVAARDLQKAQDFADKFGAKRAHGSYQDLVEDPEVDVIYVGTIHAVHFQNVKMALEAGKHVVCEKPMGVNTAEVRELIELARSKKLFLLEALWTRFFPAIRKAREVLASGELGEPRYVQGNFGFVALPEDEPHRLWDPEQAGGAMLDIGPYVLSAALMVFGSTVPEQIACTGPLAKTGVDKDCVLALSWAGKGSASLLCTLSTNLPDEVLVVCSNGQLRIHPPAHCPLRITVAKAVGGGQFEEEVHNFELPHCPECVSVNFPNSEGFLHEVKAVEDALQKGLLECPEYTLDESLAMVQIMDAFRKQVGVVYPFDK